MNETDSSRDLSTAPKDAREVATDFKTGGTRCSARSTRTGEPCKRPAMLGGNVCRSHGGNAPQVKAKAQRRLQQAADALVQRLLGMALDGDTPDHVALAAIRDALDRAGLGAKQAVEVEVTKAPYEELLGDVLHLTHSEHIARNHPDRVAPAALPAPAEILDAEIVPDAPAPHPERDGERADRRGAPPWAEPAPAAPTRELVALDDETLAEVNRTNRAARTVRVRPRR